MRVSVPGTWSHYTFDAPDDITSKCIKQKLREPQAEKMYNYRF